MKVTLQHYRTCPGFGRKPGFCNREGRAWAKRLGLDWGRFVRDGIEDSELEATGNAFAIALAKHARSEAGHG